MISNKISHELIRAFDVQSTITDFYLLVQTTDNKDTKCVDNQVHLYGMHSRNVQLLKPKYLTKRPFLCSF